MLLCLSPKPVWSGLSVTHKQRNLKRCHRVSKEKRHGCNDRYHLGILPHFNSKPSTCKYNFPILSNPLKPWDSSLFLVLETRNHTYNAPQWQHRESFHSGRPVDRFSEATSILVIFPHSCSPASRSEEKLQRICSHPRVPGGEGSGSASRTQLEKEATGSRQSPRLESDLGSYPRVSAYSPASSPTRGWVGGTSRKAALPQLSQRSPPKKGEIRGRRKGKDIAGPPATAWPLRRNFSFLVRGPVTPSGLHGETVAFT